MSDKDRICAKLDKLYTYYEELKSFSAISLEEYKCNSINRRAIERTMQLIVECATDINDFQKLFCSTEIQRKEKELMGPYEHPTGTQHLCMQIMTKRSGVTLIEQ